MDISAYQHMNIRMSTRGKRPLRNLTPNDKVRAIQRIHNGETKASVSRDIGVPESTLRGWCKNEQKLRFMCRQLGPEHLGLAATGMDNPPEKRAKFELQLLPPKYATLPNYDELGFSSMPFAMDFTAAHNETLLEKLAFAEFMKKNGFHHDAMQQLGEAPPQGNMAASEYPANNMLHQLNLLALLNPKISEEATGVGNAMPPQPKPQPAALEEPKNFHTPPLLSVKNWAKDPAKNTLLNESQAQLNDKNNNFVDPAPDSSPILTLPATPFATHLDQAHLPRLDPGAAPAPATEAEGEAGQGAALLDWCKMFSASLNFLAFAAAAASMQNGPDAIPTPQSTSISESEESCSFRSAVFKREHNPLMHSDGDVSNDSFCDSEPEDLSVRSSGSKISSPANSRSQSPDKSSASSVLHSDGEQ